MSIFLKNKKVLLFSSILLITSCAMPDPVKKNNKVFLNKYSKRIEKNKKKHKEIAKKSGIKYEKTIINSDLIDSSYYSSKKGTNKIKLDVLSNDLPIKDINKQDINYLESNSSIYSEKRTLKDFDDTDYNVSEVIYLLDNKEDYSETKTMFNDIKIPEEKLYDNFKNVNTSFINYEILLTNSDYLDLINRVKKEIYLKNKEFYKEKNVESKKPTAINSLKNKFKSIFNKN